MWGDLLLLCEERKETSRLWEEYNVEKSERGSNIIFPIISRLLERISIGEKGTEILVKKIKIVKNGDGEKYQVAGISIHP